MTDAVSNAAIRIILVGPEHDTNVGAAARAMKNFGLGELALVSPVAPVGFEAVKFAKHSLEVLKKAKKYPSLSQALSGCDLAVATSGVPERFSSRLKNTVKLPDLPGHLKGRRTVGIVFGRESTGLTLDELNSCDLVCTIPTGIAHGVLNLSHAVAVVCYALFVSGCVSPAKESIRPPGGNRPATRASRLSLETLFSELVHSLPTVRDPKKVSASLRNLIERSQATEEEIRTLTAAISPLHASHQRGKKKR